MTILFPEGTLVLGNQKIVIVDSIANLAAPDLSSEIGGAGSLDISCFLIGEWNPDEEPATGNAPNRVCTRDTYMREGRTAIQPIAIQYPYNPQEALTTDDNKARNKLLVGLEFGTVVRNGDPYEVPFAALDYTEAFKIVCGKQRYGKSEGDDQAEFVIRQNLYVLPPGRTHGQVVA